MVPTLSSDLAGLEPAHAARLLALARTSIRHGLTEGVPVPVDLADLPPDLAARRATFVTLRLGGELRGCVGRLRAGRALAVDVAGNAFAAAFEDYRFPPVAAWEVDDLEIQVSLLGHLEPVRFRDADDLLAQLVPGRDGLLLEEGGRRATFLPAVWEDLPEPRRFLEHLLAKAGLAGVGPETLAYRYGVACLKEGR